MGSDLHASSYFFCPSLWAVVWDVLWIWIKDRHRTRWVKWRCCSYENDNETWRCEKDVQHVKLLHFCFAFLTCLQKLFHEIMPVRLSNLHKNFDVGICVGAVKARSQKLHVRLTFTISRIVCKTPINKEQQGVECMMCEYCFINSSVTLLYNTEAGIIKMASF